MIELVVEDNITDMLRRLNRLQRQQLPYAISRALNDTAFDARKATITQAERVFDNRKKWWTNQRTGIFVEKSNKKQGGEMRAAVHVRAYFAEIQEEGGIKIPRGRALAIPTDQAPKNLHRSDGLRRAKAKGNVFVNEKGAFQRMARRRIRRIFSFAPRARVPARFGFATTAKKRAEERFSRHLARNLNRALKTAKL